LWAAASSVAAHLFHVIGHRAGALGSAAGEGPSGMLPLWLILWKLVKPALPEWRI
jgi:hypothetical protein